MSHENGPSDDGKQMVNVTIWERTRAKLQRIAASEDRTFVAALDRLADQRLVSVDANRPTNGQQESSKPAVDSVQIRQVPAQQQVQDMQSEDDASPKTTAGRLRKSANSDGATGSLGDSREAPLKDAG